MNLKTRVKSACRVDDDYVVSLCLGEAAGAREIGNEIARLLCAHRGEVVRVRRDTKALIDRGFIALDADGIRIWINIAEAVERASDAPLLKPSTIRMRRKRDLEREQASLGDARSDGSDASHVTRALSQDLNLNKTKLLRERGCDGPGVVAA